MPYIDDVYQQICSFARARGVRRVVLFGSRTRGAALPKSDIDIAFEGGDADGFIDDVQERFWSLLMVDAVDLAGASDELRAEVESHRKVLYEAV